MFLLSFCSFLSLKSFFMRYSFLIIGNHLLYVDISILNNITLELTFQRKKDHHIIIVLKSPFSIACLILKIWILHEKIYVLTIL